MGNLRNKEKKHVSKQKNFGQEKHGSWPMLQLLRALSGNIWAKSVVEDSRDSL